MALHIPTISCINYREPLLWVVLAPLSLLTFLLGFRLVPWTAAARLVRWPLRVIGVLLLAGGGIVLGTLALASLSLVVSGGQGQFCTHFVRPAFLLPGLSALTGMAWSTWRTHAA